MGEMTDLSGPVREVVAAAACSRDSGEWRIWTVIVAGETRQLDRRQSAQLSAPQGNTRHSTTHLRPVRRARYVARLVALPRCTRSVCPSL